MTSRVLPWAWWNASYYNKQQANWTLTPSAVVSTIVLPINFSTTSLITTGKMASDCNNTRIINASDNNRENKYIERQTCNTGNTVFWANVPYVLVSPNQTSAYVYYNSNISVVSDTKPYDSSTTFVMDYSENTSTTSYNNSFVANSNCTYTGTPFARIAGIHGQAVQETSSAVKCDTGVALSTYITGDNTATFEVVIRRTGNLATGTENAVFSNGGGYIGLIAKNTTAWRFYTYSGSGYVYCNMNDNSATNVWEHIVLKLNSTHMTCYRNGVLQSQTAFTKIGTITGTFTPVGYSNVVAANAGDLDLLTVSNVARSDDWINARYQAIIKGGISFSAEETAPSSDAVPNVTLNNPTSGSVNNSVTQYFAYTPTDDSGFLNASLWSNFSGTWMANNSNASTMTNGSINQIAVAGIPNGYYVWNVQVYDNATTPQSNMSSSNYTLIIDRVAPSINTTFVNGTKTNSTGVINFYGQAYDATAGLQSIITNNSIWNSYLTASPYNFTNQTTVTEANYSIRITANDTVNNTNSTEIYFLVDRTNPTLTITSPVNNTNSTGIPSLTLSGTCSDTNGVNAVWTNDTAFTTINYSSTWSITNNTALTEGTRTIQVACNDTTGNQQYAWLNLVIDRTNPSQSITTPTNNSITNSGGIFYVNGTTSDALSGYANTTTNSTLFTGIKISSPWSFANVTTVTEGTFTIAVTSTDYASNTITQ